MQTIMTEKRTRQGVERLLSLSKDLEKCGVEIEPHRFPNDTTSAHRELFDEYEKQLAMVADAALTWWNQTVEARTMLVDNTDRAVRASWIDRPAGPASFPGVTAVIRDFWLACDRLNQVTPKSRRVAPEALLLAWLQDGKHSKEVQVISCMPYWPIGLDEGGAWI